MATSQWHNDLLNSSASILAADVTHTTSSCRYSSWCPGRMSAHLAAWDEIVEECEGLEAANLTITEIDLTHATDEGQGRPLAFQLTSTSTALSPLHHPPAISKEASVKLPLRRPPLPSSIPSPPLPSSPPSPPPPALLPGRPTAIANLNSHSPGAAGSKAGSASSARAAPWAIEPILTPPLCPSPAFLTSAPKQNGRRASFSVQRPAEVLPPCGRHLSNTSRSLRLREPVSSGADDGFASSSSRSGPVPSGTFRAASAWQALPSVSGVYDNPDPNLSPSVGIFNGCSLLVDAGSFNLKTELALEAPAAQQQTVAPLEPINRQVAEQQEGPTFVVGKIYSPRGSEEGSEEGPPLVVDKVYSSPGSEEGPAVGQGASWCGGPQQPEGPPLLVGKVYSSPWPDMDPAHAISPLDSRTVAPVGGGTLRGGEAEPTHTLKGREKGLQARVPRGLPSGQAHSALRADKSYILALRAKHLLQNLLKAKK